MPDNVVDATVVFKANGDIAGRRRGNILDQRLIALEQIGSGVARLRYNAKLLEEYKRVVEKPRNDIVDLFFEVLTESGIFVKRNKLLRHSYAKAIQKCGWPSHDQHLLAAAIDGINPSILVTEQRHVECAKCIHKYFAVHLVDLG